MDISTDKLLLVAECFYSYGIGVDRKRHEAVVSRKGDGTIVTDVDGAMQRMILEGLERLTPARFVAEEHYGKRADARQARVCLDGAVWYVDPLDGTVEFTEDDSRYSHAATLVVDGIPKAGIYIQPALMRGVVMIDGVGIKVRNRFTGRWIDYHRPACSEKAFMGLTVSRNETVLARNAQATKRYRAAYPVRSEDPSVHLYLEWALRREGGANMAQSWVWDNAPAALTARVIGGVAEHVDGSPIDLSKVYTGADNNAIIFATTHRRADELRRVVIG